MLQKFIAFIMAIISFFASLFGINLNSDKSYIYMDASYGSDERQVLNLYIPKDNDGTVGLVLLIHGGAWIAGSKDDYPESTLRDVSETLGLACASISYRYLSENVDLNDIADDVGAALQFIKEKGADHNVNINKVLLTGFSAGAHLSLFYAYSRKATAPIEPVAVVSNSGPTDLADINFYYNNALGDTEFVCLLASYACGQSFTIDTKEQADAALAAVSPITYVNENTVPTVIAHGVKDTIVPFTNAQNLDAKLTEYGVKHDFVVFPNSDHSLANDPDKSQETTDLLIQYAKEYLY